MSRFRDHGRETADVLPVLLVWLAFYAIAVVGALTSAPPSSVTSEMTVAIKSAPDTH